MPTAHLSQNLPSLGSIIDRQPLIVAPDLPLVEVISLMSRAKGYTCLLSSSDSVPNDNALEISAAARHSSVLIVTDNRLVGIFTERHLVELTASQTDIHSVTVGAVMTIDPISLVLSDNHTVMTALVMFQQHQIGHLPILDDCQQPIGIVTPEHIRQVLQPINLLKFKSVAEGMATEVIQAAPTTTILEIARMMIDLKIGSIVIVDGQEHPKPVGIVTERDLVQFQAFGLNLEQLLAEAVMSSPLFCLQSTDSLWTAHQIMQAKNIRRLIITNDRGELAGILTQSHLLQLLDPLEMLYMLDSLQSQLIERVAELERIERELQVEVARREQMAQQDLQQAETALRQSEQRFRAIFDGTFQFVGLLDTKGILLEANRTALAAIGATSDDVVGQAFWATPWWTHSPDLQRQLQQAVIQAATGELVRFEAKHFLANGSQMIVDFSLSPIFDGTGKVVMLIPEGRDISDRKRIETELQASRSRYRALVASAPVGIFQTDAMGNTLFLNQQCLELMGMTLVEALGRGWINSLHPDDREWVAAQWYSAVQADLEFSTEHRFITPEGRVNWVFVKAIGIYDEIGTMTGYIGTVIDITERKAAAQKIQEQAALLNFTTDAIIVRDLDNQIQFWNNGAESIYGWKSAEAVGVKTTQLLYRDVLPEVAIAAQAVRQQGAWQGELHKLTKTGTAVIVESRWTLIRDDVGNPTSILSVDTDITAKKQLEQQFLRAQRLESLGSLASGIAHDLNNVLTPIVGAAQLLPLTLPNLDARNQRLLNMLVESSKRGSGLVKQILTFARGMDGERTVLQIRHILAEIVSVARQTFPASIEINLNLDSEDLWLVSVDATQIHQVLMNLFVNARDAMPTGGKISASAENITIDAEYPKLHLQPPVGSYLLITIADTGIGMDRQMLERIFDPFFTTKETGTGLGLSTVQGIIKTHGGSIDVESEIGQGTSFKIYLPAILPWKGSANDSREAETPTVDEDLSDGKGQLILVVDDEVAIQEIIQASLETYNYRVMLASDGIEAIDIYAQNHQSIAIVLVDMMMPQLDTLSIILTLQQINPEVKIVVMSGSHLNLESVVDSQKLSAFLNKPFTTTQMLQTFVDIQFDR
jgi:PAS domain S-box-containing protein